MCIRDRPAHGVCTPPPARRAGRRRLLRLGGRGEVRGWGLWRREEEVRGRARGEAVSELLRSHPMRPYIKHKKPHSSYKLYSKCGFLYWISGWRLVAL
eukprot:1359973-Rhodomonas_salina.1